MSKTRLNFLIADDHALFREGVALVLQQLDHVRIDHACNAKEIIARIEQAPIIDILLLDYNMPGVSCRENVQHICAVAPLTAIIIMSADDSPSTIKSCLDVGVNGFIPKSFQAKPC
jgi:DNA-binding NarL/FixJ family response regulator